MHKTLFKNNAFDLSTSVEQSSPLIIKFRRNNGGLGSGYIDPTLLAKFENINRDYTRIDIELNNPGIYIPVVIILLSFFIGLIKQNLNLAGALTIIFTIIIFAYIDIYKKSILLKRFEELIHNC
ncbi:MAG: hypothetical protein QM768_18435 [Agriterribacter sp.]